MEKTTKAIRLVSLTTNTSLKMFSDLKLWQSFNFQF